MNLHTKGQTNLKTFFQDSVSSKKRTNEFDFTTMILKLTCYPSFLEEIEDTKNIFRN